VDNISGPSEDLFEFRSGRGGMDKNAFGGHERLDKCNLQGPSLLGGQILDVLSGLPGERTLWAQTILDSVNNYLFFGLGRNGTSAEEFWFSVEFIFNVRASKPETWQHARYMRETHYDETLKRRVTRTVEFSDEVLKAECLDTIWSMGQWPIPLDLFVEWVRLERKKLIDLNRRQFEEYVALLNKRSMATVLKPGQPIPFKFYTEDLDKVLTEPANPMDLVELIRYQPRRRAVVRPKPKAVKRKRSHTKLLAKCPRKPVQSQPAVPAAEGVLFGFQIDSVESANPVVCGDTRMSA
jgi:hypothetical protein